MSVLSVLAVVLTAFVALLGLGIVAGVFFLLWKLLRAVFWGVGRVLVFVKREVVDTLHACGALVTACVTIPLAAVNFTILRMGSARHYARAFVDELAGVGVGLWRVALGNPLRLVGLGALVDTVERRLPDVMERAPRPRRARRATFDGYDVIGTLPSGGSGAQLFVARPKSATHKRFLAAGRGLPGEVVIKSFALEAGSTLPQIVRESRALEAASRLGLVCEHQLSNDHFYYVMPYVKGEDLERVTRALHARGTAEGLADAELRLALGYGIDLCDALQRFHSGGLWHKDVKPANVIVAKGRAHLVDFGLVTPLASAMTLTTHGTEYYRDPEMVRLAMQGVKVHEVDGVRFDVYSAGAVLYSMLENGFPAHGSLSRLSKRCPDALRWIVQRAMAEMGSRYPSAAALRADLAHLAAASDPFAVRPADLPSFGTEPVRASVPPPPAEPRPFVGVAPDADTGADAAIPAAPSRRRGARRFVGLAAAGMLGFFFLASGAALFAGRAQAHRHARVMAEPLVTVGPARVAARVTRAEREFLERARRLSGPRGERERTPEASSSAPATAPAPSEAQSGLLAVLPAHGRVLVLDDLTTSVDERVLALLRTKLAEGGFDVVGDDEDDAAASAAVERIAAARNTLGLGRADEPETQTALQAFLDQAQDLDALILVSRDPDESEHLYRVFVRGAR